MNRYVIRSTERVLDDALGVIVHSDFARRLVVQSHPHLPVVKVNLPVAVAEPFPDAGELRERYGIPADRVVIGSYGLRQPGQKDRAGFARGREDRVQRLLYLLVGEVGRTFAPICAAAVYPNLVRATGYVDWKTFNDYCHLIDVGIDLRHPTMGESSASVCRILGAGEPCVMSRPWLVRRAP